MRILVRQRAATAASEPARVVTVAPLRVRVPSRLMRVLDFDVECRPLHFYGDLVSKELTAMAWAWTDEPDRVTTLLLGDGDTDVPAMLNAFVAAYDKADMVTGHFIRGFDLPLIAGALTEYQMPMLGKKLTHDTKLDLVRRHGLSGSQENIGGMLGLKFPKEPMDQTKWRAANRLTPRGLAEVKRRVTGDVRQHIEMRKRLLELGYLGPPRQWEPGGAGHTPTYTP